MTLPHNVTVSIKLFDRGQLKAFVDVSIVLESGEIKICGFRVIQKNGENPWVAYPTISYEKDGQVKNKPLVEVTRGMRQVLAMLILAEYQKAIGGVPV